jgi:integrase
MEGALRPETGRIAGLAKPITERVSGDMLDGMKPSAARNWLKAIRALVRHCIDVDLLKEDITLGIRLRPSKGEFHTWSEDEISAFEATFAIGTRERLALALGLYTGQRRGDVIRMGRQHVRDGVLHVRQEKTNAVLATTKSIHFLASPVRWWGQRWG